MGLLDRNKPKTEANVQPTTTQKPEIQLSPGEISWLLTLIKNANFAGKDVQMVYETVVKLQLMLNKLNK